MSRADDLRVTDILEAADQLSNLVADSPEGFREDDWLRERAAERLLEIVGEAANGLSEAFRAGMPDVEWRHIINLRHLLAHHYFRVDRDQIWTIVTVNVPALARRLRDQASN